MNERVDVLMPPGHRSGYGVLPIFTKGMYQALQRQGFECRLLGNEEGPTPDLVSQILRDPPDCTLSFNGLLPDAAGRFFCEHIQIPHVACLVDSPNQFLSLIQSPLNIITCVDQAHSHFFRDLHQPHTLFLPHAVERDFTGDIEGERAFEVVFLGTCFDFEERRSIWREKYPTELASALDEAAEIVLSDQTTSYLEAFTQAVHSQSQAGAAIDLDGLDMSELFDHLEVYIRGKDRVDLVRAITDFPVHVFGSKNGKKGWDHYLQDAGSNVHLHGSVSYQEALNIMRQSRVVLNSCPTLKQGAHERIHAGLMAGAAVLTSRNTYLDEQFSHKELATYLHTDYANVNQELSTLLGDEIARKERVVKGRKKVLQQHTWDHRAEALAQHLTDILPSVQ